jgi:hypothetical protein
VTGKTTGKNPSEPKPEPTAAAVEAQEGDEQPVSEAEQAVHPQRQVVPADTTSKTKGKFPGDPNWYPDPDKPPARGY